MKAEFYPKLAWNGIRKNKTLYLPYILTCIGMVMMYYIILFLQYSDALSHLPGAGTLRSMLGLGGWIIAIFALIFLFYTNSFLVRRRKKEFGLYNILGMDKWNIGRILFWEAMIVAAFSLAIGLVAGIALSKLAELGLVNVLKGDATYTLSIAPEAIFRTGIVFCVIFTLLFLNTLRQIRLSNAIALLHSDSAGEKPPKANWFFGILGAVVLAGAYSIAVSIKEPISALLWFFAAAVMVILGSYLLFISGSVMFCRILQKKKNYYYQPNHFVSVSSMAYRMKRNGAGLASVCILATMVLVMISSTTSLYFGVEDVLNTRYPKEINLETWMQDVGDLNDQNISAMREAILGISNAYGSKPENNTDYRFASLSGLLENGVLETDVKKFNTNTYSNVYQVYFVPVDDYNRMMGTRETLEKGEILVYAYRAKFQASTLTVNGGGTVQVKKHLDKFIGSGNAAMNAVPSMYIVVPNLESGLKELIGPANFNEGKDSDTISFHWTYEFDTQLNGDQQIALAAKLRATLRNFNTNAEHGVDSYSCDSREANRGDFYGTFGGLFFLGVVLSIVFIFAAVLIIYYKQISEGYEDQDRFEIMQQVGMTKKEIRRSINSQLLTVFFMPLIGAGIHLAFAFPMIRKLLLLFNLNNVTLFALTTIISFLVFAVFYTFVYRITSNAYYNIVSGMKTTEQ
ncbi:MAG: ABC transporter permease [Oscillospiraceae bacterium]|nr:ABC transporter permease [Oscillospiraceae bacterium]